MNAMRLLAVGAIVCLVASFAGADEKKGDYAKLIVGKWEVSKSEDKGPPKGSIIEFTKDGKVHVAFERDGNKESHEGTYKVDGDKFTVTHKEGDQEKTMDITINKLDATTLNITDKDGHAIELMRKK